MEFRVTNFKSIRDTQVLSMAASKDTAFEDTHVFNPDGASFKLLKSAAIYGPNAGGKSNLLRALDFVQSSLFSKRTLAYHFLDKKYKTHPFFKLDMASRNNPSEFEVTYIDKGVRYQYGFSILGDRVVEEWLLVYKSDKPQEWFHRSVDEKTGEDVYKFSSHFKGQKLTWQKSTRKETFFLAVAANLNSEQLRPVYRWLMRLEVLNYNLKTFYLYSQMSSQLLDYYSIYFKDERYKKNLLNFLIAADVGIADFDFETQIVQGFSAANKEGEFTEHECKRPVFIHPHDGTSERFEFEEESEGTMRLFLLAFYILESLRQGIILIIDELESSLHPKLVRFIIGLFNSSENKNGAQLIFSTHNTNLLDIKETFRRDQIWFVEKDSSQATVLYPLTDFGPRKEFSIESGYLTGRYGAIPFVTEFILDGGESNYGT